MSFLGVIVGMPKKTNEMRPFVVDPELWEVAVDKSVDWEMTETIRTQLLKFRTKPEGTGKYVVTHQKMNRCVEGGVCSSHAVKSNEERRHVTTRVEENNDKSSWDGVARRF